MPVSASRPPPPPVTLKLDDHCPPRRNSPPYSKLADSRPPPPSPPPHASLPSSPKPLSSPRTEKKAPLSPPLPPEDKRVDKSDRRPSSPTSSRGSPPAASARTSEEKSPRAKDDPIVDMETFNQILELDEDGEHDFSQQMVEDFYAQAEDTFKDMDNLFAQQELQQLSDKGHFLKGSSAAIGLVKVQKSCEEIQNYGKLKDNERSISREEALKLLGDVLKRVREEYASAKAWLDDFYEQNS